MDIKQNILKRLNSLYNFAITQEKFDRVTFFGIGKKIQELRKEKTEADIKASNTLLLDTLVSEYDNPTHKMIARTILKNQLMHISVHQAACAGSSQPGAHLNQSFVMGITAKVVRQLLVFDGVIGIQPMPGPVGLIYHMAYRADKKTPEEIEKTKEGNPKEFDFTVDKISLEVISAAVTAYSRRLQAGWTLEAMQDMRAFNGLDLEAELISVISSEVSTEVSWEIISDLVRLAEKNEYSQRLVMHEEVDGKHVFMSDRLSRILIGLNQNSHNIARVTRRGPGNKIITTPMGAAFLQSQSLVTFVSAPKEQFNGDLGALQYVGYLTNEPGSDHKMYEVYISLAPVLTDNDNEVKFLVGYKGGNGECDTGYIYSPYVPVITSGVVVNPLTFQPLVRLSTRYGKWMKGSKSENELESKEANYIGKASDYYNLLTVEVDFKKFELPTEETTENPQ